MDFSGKHFFSPLSSFSFFSSIGIIRTEAKKKSNDMKRALEYGAKHTKMCRTQKEWPFNHIFPYDGLLCIVMSFNVIVLLLRIFFCAAADDDDDILCPSQLFSNSSLAVFCFLLVHLINAFSVWT
jgi:hypothetical protein